MIDSGYEDLLGRMPAIAKAVNAFESPDIQQRAFDALIGALGVDPSEGDEGERVTKPPAPKERVPKARKTPAAKNGDGTKKRPKSSGAGAKPKLVNSLELSPTGKKSWEDFHSEKSPASNQEKALVAVFWLMYHGGIAAVDVNHVFTCFEMAKWRTPTDLANTLQYVASQKSWLETTDMSKITYTIKGKNHVVHDLPAAAK